MGGRGGSGGKYGSPDGVFSSKKETTIETIYRRPKYGDLFGGRYTDEILEAKSDGKGNITFKYAKNPEFGESPKTNIKQKVKFNILAGAVNGETFNINWSKVNSISGQTYSLRSAAKAAGLKWNGEAKKWERK